MRAAIAARSVRIADAEGLEAVTMRRLAGELGIAVMSLYNYVPAKEHLAQLMTDRVAAGCAYPGPRGPGPRVPGPRAAIADLARQTRDIARRRLMGAITGLTTETACARKFSERTARLLPWITIVLVPSPLQALAREDHGCPPIAAAD